MRGLGIGGIVAVALALVVLGVVPGSGRGGGDATPPPITVDGAEIRPAGYTWSSAGSGPSRRMPARERPHHPSDFASVRPGGDGALTIRLDGYDGSARVEVAFFAGVGTDGQPLTPDGRRWRGRPRDHAVRVTVPHGAGFVAVTVTEPVPDQPSALPGNRSARYGARLPDRTDRGDA